jgi:hypothetical protein
MKKYSLAIAGIMGLAIVPCIITKSVVLAIICVVASISMLMINDFVKE